MKRRIIGTAAILVLVGALYLLLWPVPIDPVAWTPAPDPGFDGAFAADATLAGIERLVDLGAGEIGPEDTTLGADGLLYTGLQDGRIVRFDPESGAPAHTFADTGGRPLGMQFDAAGDLIVADAFAGLLSIAPDGAVTVLADAVGGVRMVFPDDLDIAAEGTIWFSDASQRFDQHDFMLDFLEGRPTGRLLSYSPASGAVRVHLEGLGFANGVALGPDDAFVLVTETLYARITRLWLRGPRAGETDLFAAALPGHPDNLSYNDAGIFWVALPAARMRPLESLAPYPFVRKILQRVPGATDLPIVPFTAVVGLDTGGGVVHSLQDPGGRYPTITSVNEFRGFLYFGSIYTNAVGRIKVPGSLP